MPRNNEVPQGQVLLVTRQNLPLIVAQIAPELLLVRRDAFVKVATDMLLIVEAAASDDPAATLGQKTG